MSEEQQETALQDMQILLLDDDPLARGVIKSFLRRHGVVLGQDQRTRDGTTLPTRGSKLSPADIVRLQDLDKINGVEDPWIIKPYD